MADDRDDSQQTEEPTQRHLDDARASGDVVKSHEVTTFVVLAGGTLAVAIFGHSVARDLTTMFQVYLENAGDMGTSSTELMALMRETVLKLFAILMAPFGLMMAAGLLGHLVQGRPVFTASRMSLDLTKLSPLKGLGRLFGMDGLINLVKGVIKMAIVGAVMWTQLWPERTKLESVLGQAPIDVAGDMMHLLFKIAIAMLVVMLVVAGLDYFWQRFRFMQRNRMSKQEIKEEFRESEGDPAVKGRIRQIRNDRARRRMMAAVPQATVVITNPTHFAVALLYESGKMDAPICVAKGMDALALRIRKVAEDNDVPIVENPPLARALHASVEVDEAIPAEHYKAVAQVIGFVMRLTDKIKAPSIELGAN
jgi:flagellar biosynthetic protein FlhB